MRRVVVTPTFVAGLGVVVAAVLAYPMQTVFSYAGPGGSSCRMSSCGLPSHSGGEPAAVRGGNRLPAQAPGTSTGAGGGGGGTQSAGNGPSLSYQTSRTWPGRFGGIITIAFRPGYAPAHWRLRFGYPVARILRVWAGRYLPHGTHSAVVAVGDWPRRAVQGRPVMVSIGVSGRPGPPGKCFFNGRACQITEHLAGGQG